MSSASNLLLVTFDQWRGDWGDPTNPVIELPALNKLASEGVVAKRCYTSSPHCVPARFSWLTGLAPSQMGVTKNLNISLPADAPSMVRRLQQQGWHTEIVGKTHWTSHAGEANLDDNQKLLQELGFDAVQEVAGPRALRRISCALTKAWEHEGYLKRQREDLERRYGKGLSAAAWEVKRTVLPRHLYPDIWIADRALESIQRLPTDKPWLLWVSFVGPHEPFDTPEPWSGHHREIKLPKAKPSANWMKRLDQCNELRTLVEKWEGLLSDEDIRSCQADYADHLRLLDDQLSRLIKSVEKRVDFSETAILATADHGELLGDAGALYKGCFLEGAIRVPWVYRPAGGTRHEVWTRPLPLTRMIEQVMQTTTGDRTIGQLRSWARRCVAVTVEFGDELVLIRGMWKVAVDERGKVVWATHAKLDPDESINRLEKNRWTSAINPKIQLLKWIARREWVKRRKPSWKWRDLSQRSIHAQP